MTGLLERFVTCEARAFVPGFFGAAEDRRQAVRRALRPLDADVASVLRAQNLRFAPSAAREANLAALERGAAAVVTGQQVGLFLGPLFTLYKAATAVATARALEQETGARVVPVFWLQTEDHDLPEIASFSWPAPTGELRTLSVPAEAEQRVSVAHLTLPEEVRAALDRLHTELSDLRYASEHLERLANHYRPGVSWGSAFASVLAELFAHEGLVLLDPRDPGFSQHAASVHRRALCEHESIATALLERDAELRASGLVAAVHVRAGSPLSFVHRDGALGERHRVVAQGEDFCEVSGAKRYAQRELLELLETDPMRFSTSALLRPVLQDTLLPTAVYVGGPGELGYFAQLAPVYRAFELEMPLFVLRARVRIVEERTRRALTRLGIGPSEAALDETALLAQLATRSGEGPARAVLEAELAEQLEAALEAGLSATGTLRAELEPEVQKTRATLGKSVAKLAARYETLRLHRDERRTSAVRRVRALLYPGGEPQERVHGFAHYAARYGERAFLEGLSSMIAPFDPTPQDLQP